LSTRERHNDRAYLSVDPHFLHKLNERKLTLVKQ
jgi:hypothetical protein